ncbi:MAG TPA: sulfite exporter TauE/SafE family protein [Sphingobacterium sp.]|nr:sulfite exporter TauE/SafE family protein [Sphingobacterium sp.]
MTEFVIILIGFAIGGWIQGLLGFGFAVATTLLLMDRMDFTMLVFLNLSMSVLTSLIAMLSGKNLKSIHKSTLSKLMISSLIGLLIGTVMLGLINAIALKKVTLLVILVASLVSLTKNKALFTHSYMAWISGFFSGVLTPSTGINGPLVVLHLNAAFTDKESTRNTMLAYLFLIMVFGMTAMGLQGGLPAETWDTLSTVILPSFLGYVLGMLSFRLLSHDVFKITITVFLIGSSLLSFIYLIL